MDPSGLEIGENVSAFSCAGIQEQKRFSRNTIFLMQILIYHRLEAIVNFISLKLQNARWAICN